MIRPRTSKTGTKTYEVWAYDPATQRKRYAGTRRQKGVKSKAAELDPAVYAVALEYQAERELRGAHERGPRATLAVLREQWIAARSHPNAERRWKASTERHNRESTLGLVAHFGDQHPDGIPRADALAWAREHPSQLNQAKALVNWARDEGLCTRNPFERPGISKGPGRSKDVPLTEDDLGALDEACAVLGAYAGPMRGWLYFQAYVGLRPAEGLGLERADLDLGEGLVHIRQQKYRDGSLGTPKNGQARTVILPDPARAHLDLIPARLGSPWLFHNRRGEPLLYGSMLGYWHTVCAAAGLATDRRWLDAQGQPKGIDPYHLRHFCGSHLADLGLSAQDIAIQLGHTDGGALAQAVYIHVYADRARARLHAAYRSERARMG